MTPIPAPSVLSPGDVLHHAAFGFAEVDAVLPSGARLRWETPGAGHPIVVPADALAVAYWRCHPDGLLARSVHDADGIRDTIARDALGALARLMLDMDGPVKREDVRDWMLARRLFSPARFDAWWDAVLPDVVSDARFRAHDGLIALADGVDAATIGAWVAPSVPLGELAQGAALTVALRVAEDLARLHAAGRVLPADARIGPGGIALPPAAGARVADADARRDDVAVVVRAVLELVTGVLPSPALLGDAPLIPLLSGACPEVPVELLAVATEALAADRALRPADGSALAERLAVAAAIASLRSRTGWLRACHAAAGFDTHVGLLKSLQSQTNQDSFLALGEPGCALLAVFDGISQCNVGSGDLASSVAARAVRTAWELEGTRLAAADSARVHAWLVEAFTRANAAVCNASRQLAGAELPRSIPMGTTAVIAVLVGNRVHVACAGDSRAYVVGRHGAAVLTCDHNVIGEHLRASVRGGPSVRPTDVRFALTSFLGRFDEDMHADPPFPFARTIDLLSGEWLVLCSDGLVDYSDAEEAGLAQRFGRLTAELRGMRAGAASMELARRLVAAANEGGGGDNVTVLALTLTADYGAARAEGPVA
jgi:serine/threonine protein phosphatase PrpC